MLTTQLKTTFALIILFLTVAIAAKAIGSLQPPNPALRGFIEGCEDKPQPCWYGIVPGITLISEARELLETYAFQPQANTGDNILVSWFPDLSNPCYVQMSSINDDPIHGILINRCPNLLSGDIMTYWGSPQPGSVSTAYLGGLAIVNQQNAISFTANSLLFQTFDALFLIPKERSSPINFEWHGFVPLWRYCQIEPAFADCLT